VERTPVGEDGLLDGADELVHGRRRHAHPLGAELHPPRVLLRPEQRVAGAPRPPVRLHPLEQPLWLEVWACQIVVVIVNNLLEEIKTRVS